jgi:uncharacterized Zn finger protein
MSQPQIIKISSKAEQAKIDPKLEPRSPDPEPNLSPPINQGDTSDSGREWWAQRWVDVLESFGWRRRLERARNYVREGRVLSLEFQGANVIATVQGTAPEPYDVKLSLDAFTEEEWGYAIEEMSGRAIFAAKLLVGEMPRNIEEAFIASGLSLFPFSKFDIHSHCSCPDPVNPCKHIGAVYYLLGDYFSQDPFILFQLRGKTKPDIITALRQLRTTEANNQDLPERDPETTSGQFTPPQLGEQFWQYRQQLDATLVVIAPPPSQETVLDVLGSIPLTAEAPQHQNDPTAALTMECLQKIYQQVAQQALIAAMTSGGTESA